MTETSPINDSNLKVFLSYGRDSKDLADRLGTFLTRNRCRPLGLDAEFDPGVGWRGALGEALAEADGVVLIVDPEPSEYLRAEWSAALQACWEEGDKRLVPFLRPGAEAPPFLQNVTAVHSEEGAEDDVFDRVLELLQGEGTEPIGVQPDTHLQLLQRLDVAIDALSEEEPDADELREHRRRLEVDCQKANDSSVMAGINLGIGLISLELGEPEQAVQTLGEALRLTEEGEGSFPALLSVLTPLAYAHAELAQLPEAIEVQQRAVEVRERADSEDPGLAAARQRLGGLYLRAECYEEAREVLTAALTPNREQLGPEHPRVQANEFFLAHALEQLGEAEEARRHYEIALEAADLSAQARAMHYLGLGRTLTVLGELAEARQVLARGLELASVDSEAGDGLVAMLAFALGTAHLRAGDPAEGAGAFELALAQHREANNDEGIAISLYSLANSMRLTGRLKEAGEILDEALERVAAQPPDLHLAELLYELGMVAREGGDPRRARELVEEARSIAVTTLGETDPRVTKFGRALERLDQGAGATS